MSINFYGFVIDKIEFNIAIQTETEIKGKSKYGYKNDCTVKWFKIPFQATLKNGLQNVKMGYIYEYSKEKFNTEDALTKYLAPYMYVKDLDVHAEKFLKNTVSRH